MANKKSHDSFWDFLRAFAQHWLTLMSGSLSVLLLIFTTIVSGWNKVALLLLAIACLIFASFRVWKNQQQEITGLQVRAYDEAQLEIVRGMLEPLGPNERDVLRYFVQFGEREQQRIYADAGIGAQEFGGILTRASNAGLLDREERQKSGRAGTEQFWWANEQFTAVLKDELFPRREAKAQHCFPKLHFDSPRTDKIPAGGGMAMKGTDGWARLKEWVIRESSFTDWCITAFTLALAVTGIYQYIVINGQLDAMRKDQRAWVEFQALPNKPGSDISSVRLDAGQPMTYPLGIKNSGKTPARNMVAKIYLDIIDANQEPPLERVATDTYERGVITAGIIFPDSDIKQPVVRPTEDGKPRLTAESEVNAMRDGKAYIAIYGIITYDDVFGVHHWTKFCRGQAADGVGAMLHIVQCIAYNDVDSN
jgi:hypothetical protein